MPQQPSRALTDGELLAIFNNDRADLSLLSQAEHQRLLQLTAQPPAAQSATAAPAKPSASSNPLAAAYDPDNMRALEAGEADVVKGIGKGIGQSVVNLGKYLHKVPGVSTVVDRAWDLRYGPTAPGNSTRAFDEADRVLAPTNDAQALGKEGEQVAEYFIPGVEAERWSANLARRLPRIVPRLIPRMVVESGINAGVTDLHGGDTKAAAITGAAVPVVGAAATKGVAALGGVGRSLVRTALKPTIAAMKKQPGASQTGINAQANKLVDFILEHRLTSPEKAQAVIDAAEQELQRVLQQHRGVVTDAPQRAQRYLEALERSASRQGLPAEDVAIIRQKAQELLESSPLSEEVVTTTMRPSPSGIVGPTGQPVMVPTQVKSRALRTDVGPDEALELARGSSKWGNRKTWGEQKGAATEASKAIERANRDAVKTAVPETRAPLQRQAGAIPAREALERKAFREGNRDTVGLNAGVALATGQSTLAIGLTLLREAPLRLGIYADILRQAIEHQDVQLTAAILTRLGVSIEEQSTVPKKPISTAVPGAGRILVTGLETR